MADWLFPEATTVDINVSNDWPPPFEAVFVRVWTTSLPSSDSRIDTSTCPDEAEGLANSDVDEVKVDTEVEVASECVCVTLKCEDPDRPSVVSVRV